MRPVPSDIVVGRVDYLVITHPLFEAELEPLLALQRSRGLSVRVLRSDSIYTRRTAIISVTPRLPRTIHALRCWLAATATTTTTTWA